MCDSALPSTQQTAKHIQQGTSSEEFCQDSGLCRCHPACVGLVCSETNQQWGCVEIRGHSTVLCCPQMGLVLHDGTVRWVNGKFPHISLQSVFHGIVDKTGETGKERITPKQLEGKQEMDQLHIWLLVQFNLWTAGVYGDYSKSHIVFYLSAGINHTAIDDLKKKKKEWKVKKHQFFSMLTIWLLSLPQMTQEDEDSEDKSTGVSGLLKKIL